MKKIITDEKNWLKNEKLVLNDELFSDFLLLL